MGSIQHINNPKDWKVILECKSNILRGDYIYLMSIGWCDDEVSFGVLYEYISKDNYNKLLDGIYKVKAFPYNLQKIILFDENNDVVPLVKGRDDSEYGINQKEYIKKIER